MDKCKHPEDQREPYHDMTVKCCACNCVIEQFGKPIDPPSPLSPKIWPVESSREPACSEVDLKWDLEIAEARRNDLERLVADMRNGFLEIYRNRGEDELIARICNPLLEASKDF